MGLPSSPWFFYAYMYIHFIILHKLHHTIHAEILLGHFSLLSFVFFGGLLPLPLFSSFSLSLHIPGAIVYPSVFLFMLLTSGSIQLETVHISWINSRPFSRFLNSKFVPTGLEGVSTDKSSNSVTCQRCSLQQCLLPAVQMCRVRVAVSAQCCNTLIKK